MHSKPTTEKLPSRSRFTGPVLCAALLAASHAAFAQTPATPAPATEPSNSEVVKLNPFTVSTQRDYGYRASNSIAGTRTDTPIKDVPLNIQVFTKDMFEDLGIKNQVDLEAYNASMVNGGADRFSDNVLAQSYQNFLFRGFRQNWGLRDGVREYDPIDAQGLARVEVVKGPAAALYGLAYPGGVMNNISKTVDFSANFAQARITAGNEGDLRATLDANFTGALAGGKFGLRFNAANEKSMDSRAHSEGFIHFININSEWQPTPNTSVAFLMERGSRGKPNGLSGYFAQGETGATGNQAAIPIQVLRNLPWDYNWADGVNMQTITTKLYRGSLTQKVGDNFSATAYFQYSDRLDVTTDGFDANGSGGGASWDHGSSGYDFATNTITATYDYRDWGNEMRAYGATGVYKMDFAAVKNTFAFGFNVWAEDELSRSYQPVNPLASAINIKAVVGTSLAGKYPKFFKPTDVQPNLNGNGFHHEDNSNDYYFVNWQMAALDSRLKTNIGINKTNLKTIAWDSGTSSTNNTYDASKVSPLYGVVYDLTKEYSLFAVHSTSLFPDSTKDSFGKQFTPQVGSSIEFGLKASTEDGKLSGTLSFYKIKQSGGSQSDPNANNINSVLYDSLSVAQRAIQFPTGRPKGDIIQGGEQESKGIELDAVYQPNRNWQIVGSLAHTDHKFTESAVASTIGQTYPQAVRFRYSLLTKYTFTTGDMKGLYVGLGLSGGSKSLQDYQNFNGVDVARYEPARLVGELFTGYRFKMCGRNSNLALNIKNLLKTDDYTGWKATGSAAKLATERYAVPTSMVFRLTLGIDL